MSQTYSTVNRDVAGGRVYSTQRAGLVTASSPQRPVTPVSRAAAQVPATQAPAATQPPATTPASAAVPLKRFTFRLNSMGLPGVSQAMPGLSGTVTLEGRSGEPYQIRGQLMGLPPSPDPAIQPCLWLIHDLAVPANLDQADLAALPKGAGGSGNQPGSVFTLDGNSATYGPQFNTLSVTVSPGRFTSTGGGAWTLVAPLDPSANQAFHPLYFAGPEALADPNQPVPSGMLAHILTDLFMRPATVHPELSLRSDYLARLKAITARHAGRQEVLDGTSYTRAAVTLEGIVRPTPILMPTRESCILLGTQREEG